MFRFVGRTLGSLASFSLRRPGVAIVALLVGVFAVASAHDVLQRIDFRDDVDKLAEIVESLNPTYDQVLSTQFLFGDQIVSDNLSYARPTHLPCDRTSTATFYEAMRRKQCSVVLVAGNRAFLFWGWEQPRKTHILTNVVSAANQIQGHTDRNYFESYQGSISLAGILLRLNSDVRITASEALTQAPSKNLIPMPVAQDAAGKGEDVTSSEVENIEFYPQDSDRSKIPGFDRLFISSTNTTRHPKELRSPFRSGPGILNVRMGL